MKTVYVNLKDGETVQRFVKTLTALDGEFELVENDITLEARSLMGIFSLDLSHPVMLRVYNPTPYNMQALKPFLEENADEQ